MKSRRKFIQLLGASAAATPVVTRLHAAENTVTNPDIRAYWHATLLKISEPVLTNLAANKLRERMPVEAPRGNGSQRKQFTHLEAFGRTLAGIAPWLELTEKPAVERESGKRFANLTRQALSNATDPNAPDFLNFRNGAQALVDTAFLCHGLLRARRELWDKLDVSVQQRVVAAIQPARKIEPGQNNWLLFSAMVETFLARVGSEWRTEPIETALRAHEQWYKGDGVYGDGAEFHWDYYNSFVIHPFLIDVLENIGKVTPRWAGLLPNILRRAGRYASVQERLIAPDGTYPVLGRSIAYRCGAFQLLAQMSLRGELPEGVAPGQTRSELTAVIRRTMEAPDTFDANGWLRVGLAGHQPGLAETYITTGSLYLCSVAFLPLGLPASAPFWSEPAQDWTSKRIWSGQDAGADHAIKG